LTSPRNISPSSVGCWLLCAGMGEGVMVVDRHGEYTDRKRRKLT